MTTTLSHHRRAAFGTVSNHLATLSDTQVSRLLEKATPAGTGIGGTTWRLTVCDIPVFAKQLVLTDIEQRPANRHSTANLFDLPAYCQYRLGSPGFGTWRELATQIHTTNWVLTEQFTGFPLMYHWRQQPINARNEQRHIEAGIAQWGDIPALRTRLTAIETATAAIVVFLEHIPQSVRPWLSTLDTAATETAYRMLERDLDHAATFMRNHDMIHFDVHFDNLLTDGRHTYLADYGLAQSGTFDLSTDERRFHTAHRHYDRHGGFTVLVNTLIQHFHPDQDTTTLVRRAAAGELPALPPWAAEPVTRHAATAATINRFHHALQTTDKTTAYPIHGRGTS